MSITLRTIIYAQQIGSTKYKYTLYLSATECCVAVVLLFLWRREVQVNVAVFPSFGHIRPIVVVINRKNSLHFERHRCKRLFVACVEWMTVLQSQIRQLNLRRSHTNLLPYSRN